VTDLVLTRSADDKRRYELAGYGSIRRIGWLTRYAEIRTPDGFERTTTQSPTGKFARLVEASGSPDDVVAEYERTRWVDHGGTVTWRGLPFDLAVESHWRHRFLLSRNGVEAVRVTCRGWGRKPAVVEVLEPSLEPALVLFTVWLAQLFVEMDASTGA
jgi:hypothetical protein